MIAAAQAEHGLCRRAESDCRGAAGPARKFRCENLGTHAACSDCGFGIGLAGHGADGGVDILDVANPLRRGVGARIPVVQPVDIGQEDQKIRSDQLGDACREAVIVAIADLVRGDGVVFVDDGDGAQLHQCVQRGTRIQP